MVYAPSSDLATAFDLLLAALDHEIASVREAGAEAFASGDFAAAVERAERGRRLEKLRTQVASLRDEWRRLDAGEPVQQRDVPAPRPRVRRRTGERARAGERTPERAYYHPILEALEDMGGSGRADDVLRRVYDKVVARLNPVDLQPLPLAREPRWRRTAQWARWAMVKEGLLRRDSAGCGRSATRAWSGCGGSGDGRRGATSRDRRCGTVMARRRFQWLAPGRVKTWCETRRSC